MSDAFPLHPDPSWFDPTQVPDPTRKVSIVTEGPEAGRVYGLVAPSEQCIIGTAGQECWQAGDSPTGFRVAHQGESLASDGSIIATANIGGGINHAENRERPGAAVDKYANTASQLMRVSYGFIPGVGTVAAGAAWPGISDLDIAKIRASALSGDWRYIDELHDYEFVGSQLVSVPGFPIWQPRAVAASLDDPHPRIYGGWVSAVPEEAPMPDVVTVTCGRCGGLTTAPARVAAGRTVVVSAPSTPCSCQHAAAFGDEPAPEAPSGDIDALRAEVAELRAMVEAIAGQVVEAALASIDAIEASLPEPVAV